MQVANLIIGSALTRVLGVRPNPSIFREGFSGEYTIETRYFGTVIAQIEMIYLSKEGFEPVKSKPLHSPWIIEIKKSQPLYVWNFSVYVIFDTICDSPTENSRVFFISMIELAAYRYC